MRIPRTVSGPIRRASFALLFIGLLPATTAWAQDTLIIRDTEVEDDDEPARIRIGIKGGFNFATFSNAAPNLDRQTGFAAGASLPIRLNDILEFQPEALFVQKGPETQEIRFIEVPVFLRLNLPVEQVRPFVLGGGFVGFKLSCDYNTGTDHCPPGVEDRDYGVALGGGLRLGGRMGFTIEGRYTWGLKDIDNITAGVDERTRTFMLMAGIEF